MTEEIVAMAMALGQRTEEERELLTTLCQTAELELAQRLKAETRSEDCGIAFAAAAAWLALAAMETGSGERVESFTAGDLTIRGAENTQRGREWRAQAERLMAPYLEDERFSFRGVRG